MRDMSGVLGAAHPSKAGSKGGNLWAGFHKGGTLLCRGFKGWKPLPEHCDGGESGVLGDGFGVPSARNIACDV